MKKIFNLLFFFTFVQLGFGQLIGDYYIPKGANPQGFTNLVDAINAVNTNGLSGTVNFYIDGDLSEIGANLLLWRTDLNEVNNLVIKPVFGKSPTLTISGCTSASVETQYSGFTFNGTGYVTIDGSNTVGGNTKDLTFTMNDVTNGRNVIQLRCNSDFVTIKNLNITYQTPMSTADSTRGIYLKGVVAGVVDNFSIDNCNIGDSSAVPSYAVSINGYPGNLNYSTNITIKNSNLYGKTCPVYFFYVGTAGTTSEIRNNYIYVYGGLNTTNTYTVLLDTWAGTFNLFNNQLPVITTNNNDTSGVYGISGLNAQTAAICNIYNNFIGGNLTITGTGVPSVASLMYLQDNGTYNVYYNSFNYPSVLSNTERSCIHISGSSAIVTLVNNIIVNNADATNAYCIWKSNGLLVSDYNDLYVFGGNANIGYVGGSAKQTLVDWQTATGQDVNSISDDPHFISDTDLHINTAFSTICDIGVAIASVTTDIDGDVRSATTPDIGADEYNCGTSTFQLSVNVANGWNMVSIPGLHPTDQNANTWWAFRDLGANVFRYAGGYQSVTDAVPGIGYWMKHTGDRTYNTGDEWPAGGIQIVPHNQLDGALGWNLFGGYELSVTAVNVTTVPSGQQSGPIYRYSGGYQVATTLDPGYGYWIKLLSASQIIIPESLAKGTEPVEYFPDDWGKIVLTDATGINYTLFAVKGETDLSQYELPPSPPTGMFDIRFSSGRIAEDIVSSVKTIDMNGVTYPLTVRVEGMDIRLMDETGKTIKVNLKSGEDVVISDATVMKLMVSGELIPAQYALEQNYPNPFNPSTVIEFSLPEDVSNVKLSIYNALGEKVAELVNTALTAGKYQYQWNAQNVATGMYIYELRTDKFVSVKKMLLLK